MSLQHCPSTSLGPGELLLSLHYGRDVIQYILFLSLFSSPSPFSSSPSSSCLSLFPSFTHSLPFFPSTISFLFLCESLRSSFSNLFDILSHFPPLLYLSTTISSSLHLSLLTSLPAISPTQNLLYSALVFRIRPIQAQRR